jgi:hypothetical protein
MAIPNVNVSWYGQSSLAQGQIYGNNATGPQNEALIGIGTAVLDGATTTFQVNFIDGVQSLYKNTAVLSVSSVAAPATIGGVANQAVYSGVGAYGALRVGQSITFAGFTNAANNGTFVINALTTSTVQVTNASSVAETNPQASLSFNYQNRQVAGFFAARAVVGATGVADTAASSISLAPGGAGGLNQLGGAVTISSAGSNGQTLSFIIEVLKRTKENKIICHFFEMKILSWVLSLPSKNFLATVRELL